MINPYINPFQSQHLFEVARHVGMLVSTLVACRASHTGCRCHATGCQGGAWHWWRLTPLTPLVDVLGCPPSTFSAARISKKMNALNMHFTPKNSPQKHLSGIERISKISWREMAAPVPLLPWLLVPATLLGISFRVGATTDPGLTTVKAWDSAMASPSFLGVFCGALALGLFWALGITRKCCRSQPPRSHIMWFCDDSSGFGGKVSSEFWAQLLVCDSFANHVMELTCPTMGRNIDFFLESSFSFYKQFWKPWGVQ